jgi:hypothetical protein
MDLHSVQSAGTLSGRRLALTLPLYAATIFFSAFLLFGIQPMFAKMVLPKLGGSPGVWSVAMVFFQAVLLAGYGYAHWLVSRFSVRRAALIHISLIALVLIIALPIGLASGFQRPPEDGQILWLVALFSASVGLPFFAVSANGPLLQAWFARTGHPHAADPYFLYAASNIGSFLALIAYPFLIEPNLPLAAQASSWAWGFAFLLAGIACCAGLSLGGPGGSLAVERGTLVVTPIPARTKLAWVALAFVPSGLLVAITAHISTDVAAVPLLWVAPLALFLLTFTIVFQRKPLLRHSWMLHAQLVLVAALVTATMFLPKAGWGLQLGLHLALFFVTAMVAHGELARMRPDAANLTQFYLWMSVGGVLGGLFCGLLAPSLFNAVIEYPILIIAGLLCRPGLVSINLSRRAGAAMACFAFLGLVVLVVQDQRRTDTIRSFFGVHRIDVSEDGRFRRLIHGSTVHGAQRLIEPDGSATTGRPEPLTYYFTGGAIADGIDAVRQARGGVLRDVAVVGLGTGSLACQMRPGEAWDFYEIDPYVVRIAQDTSRFGFMSECAPDARIVMGDARLTLADAADGSLDMLVIDAFSSDAIPVHLMTTEAIALYLTKLKPEGAILFHISNRNMELGPVVVATAQQKGLTTWIREPTASPALLAQMKVSPHVAIVARRAEHVGLPVGQGWVEQGASTGVRAWRDDYADIISAIWQKIGK